MSRGEIPPDHIKQSINQIINQSFKNQSNNEENRPWGLFSFSVQNSALGPMKPEELKKMPKEDKKRTNAIIDWYKDLRSEKTKETYDKAKLDEVSKQILDELKELQGPTKEELEAQAAEAAAQDEDVKQAEKIDLDNFFESDDSEDGEE